MASNSNTKKAEANTKKAAAALTPKTYSDPYGKFDGSTGVYDPYLTDSQKQARTTSLDKTNSIIGSINATPTVNDLFNNDYYNTFSKYYNDTIDSEYDKSYKQLQSNLAARNQLGSSYDALMNKDLSKATASSRLAAEAQARGDSANYYTQNLSNQLNTLAGLRNDLLQAQAYEYQPFNNYLGYQNAVSPLQQKTADVYNTAAQYYYNQAASRDGVMNSIQNIAKTTGAVLSPIMTLASGTGNSAGTQWSNQGGGQVSGSGSSASQTGQYLKALASIAPYLAL